MNKTKRVVISGVGVVSSIGTGKKDFWDALLKGQSGIEKIETFDTKEYDNHLGGEVKDFDPSRFMNNETVGKTGRASQFAIAATRMALNDAGLHTEEIDLERVGVALGVTIGEGHVLKKINTKWVKTGMSSIPKELFYQATSYSIPSNVAIEFGFSGPNLMIPTACAAGNYAISRAFRLIQSGHVDIMVAGGSDALSFGAYAGFNRLNVMAHEKVQPFDNNRKGMMIGEGAGILIMESFQNAQKRRGPKICEILGYGYGCDAFHIVNPHPEGGGIRIAMESALKRAGLKPQNVDYINAHGTGTVANDLSETNAIKETFGDFAKKIPISSIKSMLGHTMGAASAIEALTCSLSVQNDIIPPTINYCDPDPKCDLDYVPNIARKQQVNIAMSNALAFGGNNSSVIFKKYTNGGPNE